MCLSLEVDLQVSNGIVAYFVRESPLLTVNLGLASAIRLKQLCEENDADISVCLLEKGSYVGAHILSGNVFEPRALNELIPDWKELGAPLTTPVTDD